MGQRIEHRFGDPLVTQHLGRPFKGLIGRRDQAGPFIARL